MVAQWKRIRLRMQEIQGRSLGQEDPLEKEMAIQSSGNPPTVALEIPWTTKRVTWTEKPGRPQSVGLQKSWTRLKFHLQMCVGYTGSKERDATGIKKMSKTLVAGPQLLQLSTKDVLVLSSCGTWSHLLCSFLFYQGTLHTALCYKLLFLDDYYFSTVFFYK